MLLSNTTEERFKSTKSIEERDLYLTKIISDIGELVTSSTATESAGIIVTNLLVLHATNAGKFRRNMYFWLSFVEEETDKLLRRSNMFPFFI